MLNKTILQGRLVADPELRYTQSNTAVLSARIACDRDFKSKDGNGPTADFINIVAWRQTGEFINKYFGKGDMILLEGRIQVRDYNDKNGNKRYATEVVVDHVWFCGSKRDKSNSASPRNTQYQDYADAYDQDYANATGTTPDYSGTADFSELTDDDGELPF
ncbi:MAG: single-stranded DNA-binding protein [Oscillospiraceae bacterium]|nr:single-stranded DNA-binding protein [Oscillospiraceae bacterium]